MTKFLSRYLKPSQISKVYIIGAILGIVLITVFFSSLSEPTKRERVAPPIESILTTKNTREIGLDAVNQKVIGVKQDSDNIGTKLGIVDQKTGELEQSASNMKIELKNAKAELAKLSKELKDNSENESERIEKAIQKALSGLNINVVEKEGNKKISHFDQGTNTTPPVVRKKRESNNRTVNKKPSESVFDYGGRTTAGHDTASSNKESATTTTATPQIVDGRAGSLFTVAENDEAVEDEEAKLYLPSTSVLTGVLMSGLDAPTDSDAEDQPIPVLIRLKKEAILPNYAYISEVRECFAIAAGYGDLGSERAYLRGESITCVKVDGEVIETELAAYAVGEDGKAGVKGTLVNKGNKVLGNAMLAGFAEGLSGAFGVSTSSSTDSNGNIVISGGTFGNSLASGASESMSKLSDYYMKLADAMFPVIEVGAGRVVDLVVTKGTEL